MNMKRILINLMLIFAISTQTFGTVNLDLNDPDVFEPEVAEEGWSSADNDLDGYSTDSATTKLKAPLLNMFSATEWSLFMREFEMKMDIGTCCREGDIMSCAIGFAAKMIEPIGYMETTQKPLYFPFADIDLGGNIIKGGSLNQENANSSTMRSAIADAHFIYVPIMGLIFKKSLKFVCFHSGDLLIPYISEFDPTWKQDLYYGKMIPHMLAMFSPQGLLSTLYDCVATEIVNSMSGYHDGSGNIDINNMETMETTAATHDERDSSHSSTFETSSMDTMNSVRDTMYYVDGCSGFTPVGGYVNGDDIIQDATLTFHGIMALLHSSSAVSPVAFLSKQTNLKINSSVLGNGAPVKNSGPGTMCTWKDYALPLPSQYVLQLSYPTVGTAKEAGVTGADVSTGKNVPGARNSSVFTVWERRDYYAFAYFCGEED